MLSVPVLLLGKPVYLYWLHNGSTRLGMYRVRLRVCVWVCRWMCVRRRGCVFGGVVVAWV